MDYRQRPCPPPLSRYVECFWRLAAGAAAAPPVEQVPPDGCVELIFHLGDTFRSWAAAEPERQPAAFVVGPSTRFLLVQPTGAVETLGVRFRPGRAGPFLGVPLSELTDRVVPLDLLLGGTLRALIGRVQETASWSARCLLLERFLLGGSRSVRHDGGVEAAVTGVLRTRGRLGVAELGRRTGLGARQLERGFRERVGLPPKGFSRVVRFQGVFEALRQDATPRWAELASACGYYDQAHLVGEFRSLCGRPPAGLFAGGGELWRHFTSPPRLAAFFGGGDDAPL